mmetsp:Transcript_98781/g.175901  ORF Transcript_98781/g.175901 Transcript_98781/m.175901 type:complete len:491 (+) Transcript_98781:69-1541(+)
MFSRQRRKIQDEGDEGKIMDVEDAINEVGVGSMHWVVYIVVGLITAADSVEIGFIAYVTECLEMKWDLSENHKSMMESMIFAGQLIGSPFWGIVADKFGRRPAFLVSSAWISFFGYCSALSPNATCLIIIRFFVGIGVAGECVAFDIFAEMLPDNARGKLTLSTFYWWTFGTLYTTFAAWLTLANFGWRWFTAMCALPTTIALVVGFFAVPESAHWLCSIGDEEGAADVVNQVCTWNGVDLRYKKLTEPKVLDEVETKDLIKRSKLRRPLMLMSVVWLGFGIAYYGVALMVPHLFSHHKTAETPDAAAAEVAAAGQMCKAVSFSFGKILVGNFGQLIGLTLGVMTIDWLGRRMVQQLSYSISAIFTIGLGFLSLGESALTIFSTVALSAQMCSSCCTWTHTPELFPTKVRVLATGLCSSAARIGAGMAPYLISNYIPPLPTALIMSAASVTAAIAVSFVRETAHAPIDDEDEVLSSDGETESAGEDEDLE